MVLVWPAGDRNNRSDDGAAQMLQELKLPFDVIDPSAVLEAYSRAVGRGDTEGQHWLHRLPDLFDVSRYGPAALQVRRARADRRLLSSRAIVTDLPSSARATLTRQDEQKRHVLHLLYGAPQIRGKAVPAGEGTRVMEMIEDIPTLGPVAASVRLPRSPSRVYDALTGEDAQPVQKIAETIASITASRLSERGISHEPHTITLNCDIILRGSTRRPPAPNNSGSR